MSNALQADYLIIGGGIIGLAVAKALLARNSRSSIILVEKEPNLAEHGSGRNSGVLHAGFYYSADSLKAKFCRDGNVAWHAYVKEHGLKLNPCQKVVVAKDEAEWEGVHELKRRGDANGVKVSIVDEQQLAVIDPNARTHKEALFSPTTATVDPVQICLHVAEGLKAQGVQILLSHPYRRRIRDNTIQAGDKTITAGKIINCAGLYADRVAADFGFGKEYTIIPFKGIHLKSARKPTPSVRTLIYPVPNLKNPFLGVHFNITVDGDIKIGPTAIPSFWRENYKGMERFRIDELTEIVSWEAALFVTNAFNFRALAFEEMKKYSRSRMLDLVRPMVKQLDDGAFTTWARPGIRAQLLHKKSMSLLQDFVVEGDASSVHVLNAVSPAFTCSLPFGAWVVEKYA